MSNSKNNYLIYLVLVMICGALTFTILCSNSDVINYMPLAVGNMWTYECSIRSFGSPYPESILTRFTITSIAENEDGTYYRMMLESYSGDQYAYNLGYRNGQITEYCSDGTPVILLQEPFEKGCQWNSQAYNSDIVSVEITSDNATVQVPAGIFTGCIHTVFEHSVGNGRNSYTDRWFAPNIGLVKSVCTLESIEVILELANNEQTLGNDNISSSHTELPLTDIQTLMLTYGELSPSIQPMYIWIVNQSLGEGQIIYN